MSFNYFKLTITFTEFFQNEIQSDSKKMGQTLRVDGANQNKYFLCRKPET